MDSFKEFIDLVWLLILQVRGDQEIKDPQSQGQFSGRARSKTLSSRHLTHCCLPSPIPILTTNIISYQMGTLYGKIV